MYIINYFLRFSHNIYFIVKFISYFSGRHVLISQAARKTSTPCTVFSCCTRAVPNLATSTLERGLWFRSIESRKFTIRRDSQFSILTRLELEFDIAYRLGLVAPSIGVYRNRRKSPPSPICLSPTRHDFRVSEFQGP